MSTFEHTPQVLVPVCVALAAASPLQLHEPVAEWLSDATYPHAEHERVLLCVTRSAEVDHALHEFHVCAHS